MIYRARRPVRVRRLPDAQLAAIAARQPEPEAEFQAWLARLAKETGSKYFHDHDSRRNPEGFPDSVIVTPSGLLLFAELKREADKPSAEQLEWLAALGNVQRLHSGWFRPSMRPQLERLIRS